VAITVTGCNVNWSQFDGGPDHQGRNGGETAITASNVASVTQKWRVSLPHYADGAPVIAFGVSTPSGSHDLAIVTTTGGEVVAVDLHTGAKIWSDAFGPGTCMINNGSLPCYTTSSPAVDQSGGFVYSYGLDGKVHKLALGTGVETTSSGWPETVTLKPFDEKGSSALALAMASGHTYLYMVTSGYPGDGGDYQGHLTTIDLSTGTQTVFNTLCSNQTLHFVEQPGTPDCPEVQSGVWARAGVTYSSVTDRIYLTTGNATFDPANHDWGDSILALNPNGTGSNGAPVDSYTPTDFQSLDNSDLDLGSTLPALVALPKGTLAPGGAPLSQVGVQGGKDGELRLINPADLSGHGVPGLTGGEWSLVSGPGGEILTAPAVWTDSSGKLWVEATTDSHTAGYTITVDPTTHIPSLTPVWSVATGNASPLVANGVLYAAGGTTIHAYNPMTGARLWTAPVGSIHWQSPVVDGGYILLADGSGNLTAWGP
jgi:hypothetical protein